MAPKKSNSKKSAANKTTAKKATARRQRVSQSTIPIHSLREALTVAQAITDEFGGDPTTPHQVAMALEVSPTSSGWRSLSGAAVAYGLTSGGYGSEKISLTDLGRRCTAPTAEGDDVLARGEAALTPRVPREFFEKYHRNKFPSDTIAKNVLQQDFKVPADRAQDALTLLKEDGAFVGIVHQTKTGPFVSTDDLKPAPVTLASEPENAGRTDDQTIRADASDADTPEVPLVAKQPPTLDTAFKVFITHGRNKKIVDQVKDVLDLYDIEYEIAVEEESLAIPVPEKVRSAMRRCAAGVMIVSADDENAAQSGTINNNVLIEIGAAFVLYDQRVVLLWDKRLKVPSNLQGLYRCEFEGDELTFSVGTKLAKAVKGFRR
ncbi:MAG: TIR domain-containing protein [Planctomycetota bacterium]